MDSAGAGRAAPLWHDAITHSNTAIRLKTMITTAIRGMETPECDRKDSLRHLTPSDLDGMPAMPARLPEAPMRGLEHLLDRVLQHLARIPPPQRDDRTDMRNDTSDIPHMVVPR